MKDKEFNSKGDRINSRDNDGYTCRVDSNRGTCTNNRTGESVNVSRDNDSRWGIDTNNIGTQNTFGNGSRGFSTSRDYTSSNSDLEPKGSNSSNGNRERWTGWTEQDYQEMDAIVSRNQSLMKGFTGQVLGDYSHNKRHCRDYEQVPTVNKEMLAAVRKVDRENNDSAVNLYCFIIII